MRERENQDVREQDGTEEEQIERIMDEIIEENMEAFMELAK